MPLYRRLPKRGFNNAAFRRRWANVNLSDLSRLGVDHVEPKTLVESGLVKGAFEGIKILGDGSLDRPVLVRAHAISAGARRKLEAAGGTFEVIVR
jgi:large subunit ribosomal protein L15